MTRCFSAVGLMVALGVVIGAAQAPVIDVSSVKENTSQQPGSAAQPASLSGLHLVNVELMVVIPWAHGINLEFVNTQIDWSRVSKRLLGKRFDIDINGTGDQKALLRLVLADRFGLRTHEETRQVRLSALTLKRPGTLGPQLKPSTVNCRELAAAGEFRKPNGRPPQCAGGMQAGSMLDLAREAQPYAVRPIVDRTGLRGNFEWAFSFRPSGTREERATQLRDAFEDQLGLTLKAITGPYEVLVIDALHEPTPN